MIEHVTSDTFEDRVLNSSGKVLVDFFATWCGPCNLFAPTLEEIAEGLPDGAAIYKLDIDQDIDLARRYQVMGVPTLVLFEHGEETDRAVGVQPRGRVEEMLA